MRSVPGLGEQISLRLLADLPELGRLDRKQIAALVGVSPIPASSGKTNRHRLNRGGDRQANSALHRIVVVRLRCDHRTKEYMRRRTGEGMSKLEVMRCLKRYVAREIFFNLQTSRELTSSPA